MNSNRAPLLKWSPSTWKRWSDMPRLSTTTVPRTHFLLLKAPVSTLYEEKFGGNRNVFTVPMYLQRLIAKGIAVGLVVDCTALDLALFDPATLSTDSGKGSGDANTASASAASTRRYFNNINEWDEFGVDYYQLCQEKHTDIPSPKTIQEFINVCTSHMKEHPTMKIAVYDARGGNGAASFLVAYYLCHKLKAPVTTALDLVAKASPAGTSGDCQKGLYDIELIKELQKLFSGKKEIRFDGTKLPKWWCGDLNPDNSKDDSEESATRSASSDGGGDQGIIVIPPFQDAKRQHGDIGNGNPLPDAKKARSNDMYSSLPMQELPSTSQRYTRAMTVMKQLTTQAGGNDSIPIRKESVLSMENLNQIKADRFKVTWRSVGRRGLLLILSDGIYFIEKDDDDEMKTSVSVLNTPLYIPNPQKPSTVQHRTLLDVTLVMDVEKGRIIPRFLVTDILSHMGGLLAHKPFDHRRKYMMDGVIMARKKSVNIWKYDKEGIKMRAREYFDLNKTDFVIKEVMKAQMHDTDGVMFISSDLKYGDDNSFVAETKDSSIMDDIVKHFVNLR